MNKVIAIFAGALVASASGSATALPQHAFWVEVPVVDDPSDPADLTGFRSFDLLVQVEQGDIINLWDIGFGSTSGEMSLGAGQIFFQHASGGDAGVDPALTSTFGDLTYDTRGQMGTLGFSEFVDGVAIGFDPVIWDPSGVVGLWLPNISEPVSINEAPADGLNRLWLARMTVSSVGGFNSPTDHLGEFLGGKVLLHGDGPNGMFSSNVTGSGLVDVPNAFRIPSPGTGATLGLLAGGMLIRRRR